MDPVTIMALANGAFTLIEALVPKIQELAQRGEITAAQQSELLAKYNSLKAKADGQFSGPEWAIK